MSRAWEKHPRQCDVEWEWNLFALQFHNLINLLEMFINSLAIITVLLRTIWWVSHLGQREVVLMRIYLSCLRFKLKKTCNPNHSSYSRLSFTYVWSSVTPHFCLINVIFPIFLTPHPLCSTKQQRPLVHQTTKNPPYLRKRRQSGSGNPFHSHTHFADKEKMWRIFLRGRFPTHSDESQK